MRTSLALTSFPRSPRMGGWALPIGILTALLAACGGSASPTAKPLDTGAVGRPFWIPFSAIPTGSGGREGLFVVPSDALSATPVFATTLPTTATGDVPIRTIAEAKNYAISGGTVAGFSPALLIYTATGTDGAEHVYGLNLGNITSTPTATQLSSLSFSFTTPSTNQGPLQLCGWTEAQTDLTEPTTLFVLLVLGGTAGCGAGASFDYYVVHYTDSAATSPLQVTVANPYFTPLYAPNGQLGGMVALDEISGNLYFYSNETFTSPKILLSGVTQINTIYAESVNIQGVFPSSEFLAVSQASIPQALYQIGYQGTAIKWYTAAGNYYLIGGAFDATNFYFADQDHPETIWRESVAGGTPAKILNINDGNQYNLVGSNGSLLVLNWGAGTLAQSSYYGTVPIGAYSTAVNQIWSTQLGPSNGFVASPTPGANSGDLLFITVRQFSLPEVLPITFWSAALTPSGTVTQPLTAASAFVGPIGPGGSEVLEVTHITDMSGSYDGGTLNAVDLATSTSSPITTPGGGTYTVSQGPTFAPLSNNLSAEVDLGDGAVLDASSKLIYPVTLPSTTVSAAWF
jgi:hypothetical protein